MLPLFLHTATTAEGEYLFADLINDVGLTLDMLAPLAGPSGFVWLAALGADADGIVGEALLADVRMPALLEEMPYSKGVAGGRSSKRQHDRKQKTQRGLTRSVGKSLETS